MWHILWRRLMASCIKLHPPDLYQRTCHHHFLRLVQLVEAWAPEIRLHLRVLLIQLLWGFSLKMAQNLQPLGMMKLAPICSDLYIITGIGKNGNSPGIQTNGFPEDIICSSDLTNGQSFIMLNRACPKLSLCKSAILYKCHWWMCRFLFQTSSDEHQIYMTEWYLLECLVARMPFQTQDPVLPHYRLSIRGLTILEPVRLIQHLVPVERHHQAAWIFHRTTWSNRSPRFYLIPSLLHPVWWSRRSRKGVDCSDQSLTLPLVMIRPIDPEQQLSLSLAAQWMCRPRSGRPPSLAEVPRACVGPTRFSTNPISPALELVFPPMPSYSDRKGYNLGAQSTPQTRFRKLFRLFSGGAGVPIDPTGLLTVDCKHHMMMSPEIVPFVLFRLPSYGPFCTWTSGQIKATAQTATVKNPGTPLAWTGPVLCMNELLTWAHLICSFGKKRSHKQNAYPDHTCFDSTWAKVSRDTPKMR